MMLIAAPAATNPVMPNGIGGTKCVGERAQRHDRPSPGGDLT